MSTHGDAPDPGHATACGSCGRTGEPLDEVGRIYLTIADDGTETVIEVDGTEWWCASCQATYPHTPV